MYLRHFGLREAPFSGQPGTRALFCHDRQRLAVNELRAALGRNQGAVLLTGAPGSGKSILCRLLLRSLPANAEVLLIGRPPRSFRELLERLLALPRFAFVDAGASTVELAEQLAAALVRVRKRGRLPILIIDDAHELQGTAFEELGTFRQQERGDQAAFGLLLVGREDLGDAIRARARRLDEQIRTRIQAEPLDLTDTREYVRHRLKAVGGQPGLFTEGAIRSLHRQSAGNPRRIDILADQGLLASYFANREFVDWRALRTGTSAFDLLRLPRLEHDLPEWCRVSAVFAAAFAGTLLLVGWWAGLARIEGSGREQPVLEAPAPAAESTSPPAGTSKAAVAVHAGPPPAPVLPLEALASEMATRREVAERRLLARWDLPAAAPVGAGTCRAAADHGYECVSGRGGWRDVERFNRPAALTLRDRDGRDFHAVVVSLGPDAVTLDVDGYEYTYPRTDVDRYWNGEFLLLWRSPLAGVSVINDRSSPEAIAWLRDALAKVQGRPVPESSGPPYDWALTRRVMDFQQQAGLAADGTVGAATFNALEGALQTSAGPALTTPQLD